MFERELRDLAFVPRWGIVRTVRQQNVAEHTFFVAIYADQIAGAIGWQGDRAQLFRLALAHDWDEIFTSDIAAPAKRVLKKAAGKDGWINFERWLRHLSLDRFPYFKEWIDGFKESTEAHQAEEILKVADLLEAVLYLAEEENLGNGNVSHRRDFLQNQLITATDKLKEFGTPEGVSLVMQEIIDAITSQARGQSKTVYGNEINL